MKTTGIRPPGLRLLEKYATRIGGAKNHRLGLWDGVMMKDNHIAVAQSIGQAVGAVRAAGVTQIIVEVVRVDQIERRSLPASSFTSRRMTAAIRRSISTAQGMAKGS